MFTHLSKFKAVAVAAAAVFSMASASAATDTYVDDFETYSTGTFVGGPAATSPSSFGTWTATEIFGSVDIVGDPAPTNQSLTLSGFSTLAYTFTLGSASTVVLNFDEGAVGATKTVLLKDGVTALDWYDDTGFGPVPWDGGISGNTFSMTAGTHSFSFVNTQGTFYLDNFSVSVTAAPVPEPETYAMMLAGLGALGFMARRRRAS